MSFVDNSKRRFLREENLLKPETVPKKYYTDTALNFLLNYGQHYHLFDIFFDKDSIITQQKPSHSQRNKFRFRDSDNEEIEEESEEFIPATHNYNGDIAQHYLIRDYSTFQTWGVANATIHEEYRYLNFHYDPKPNDPYFIEYSNRFRYGPNLNDRFMYIGLNEDIWQWKQTGDRSRPPPFVYFIGIRNNLQARLQAGETFYCNFTIPPPPPTTATGQSTNTQHQLTKVEIFQDIRDVLNRPLEDNIVRCPVPLALLESLEDREHHDHLHNNPHEHHHPPPYHHEPPPQTISLHFLQSRDNRLDETSTTSTPEEEVEKAEVTPLLRDITIPRRHPLDRRTYTYTIETMLETLEDSQVLEWMIYNILLGVEHFYFFLNSKEVQTSLETSLLRPFLDANLVTVIYYPYFHEHFAHVQGSAFNVHLLCYRDDQVWTSYSDVDEFLVPSSQYLPTTVSAMRGLKKSLIGQLLQQLAPDGSEPGVMFDSLEMDCPPHLSDNYYHGGWNIRDPSLIDGHQNHNNNNNHNNHTTATNRPPSSNSSSSQNRFRPAVTTHCQRTGLLFHEMTMGHGKMWLRPHQVRYLVSPHRLNDYAVIWTSREEGGLWRHFDRFRYSLEMIRSGHAPASSLAEIEQSDESLRDLTLLMVEAYLGITATTSATTASNTSSLAVKMT